MKTDCSPVRARGNWWHQTSVNELNYEKTSEKKGALNFVNTVLHNSSCDQPKQKVEIPYYYQPTTAIQIKLTFVAGWLVRPLIGWPDLFALWRVSAHFRSSVTIKSLNSVEKLLKRFLSFWRERMAFKLNFDEEHPLAVTYSTSTPKFIRRQYWSVHQSIGNCQIRFDVDLLRRCVAWRGAATSRWTCWAACCPSSPVTSSSRPIFSIDFWPSSCRPPAPRSPFVWRPPFSRYVVFLCFCFIVLCCLL